MLDYKRIKEHTRVRINPNIEMMVPPVSSMVSVEPQEGRLVDIQRYHAQEVRCEFKFSMTTRIDTNTIQQSRYEVEERVGAEFAKQVNRQVYSKVRDKVHRIRQAAYCVHDHALQQEINELLELLD